MSSLTYLNDASVLHNLKQRYYIKLIYVSRFGSSERAKRPSATTFLLCCLSVCLFLPAYSPNCFDFLLSHFVCTNLAILHTFHDTLFVLNNRTAFYNLFFFFGLNRPCHETLFFKGIMQFFRLTSSLTFRIVYKFSKITFFLNTGISHSYIFC